MRMSESSVTRTQPWLTEPLPPPLACQPWIATTACMPSNTGTSGLCVVRLTVQSPSTDAVERQWSYVACRPRGVGVELVPVPTCAVRTT